MAIFLSKPRYPRYIKVLKNSWWIDVKSPMEMIGFDPSTYRIGVGLIILYFIYWESGQFQDGNPCKALEWMLPMSCWHCSSMETVGSWILREVMIHGSSFTLYGYFSISRGISNTILQYTKFTNNSKYKIVGKQPSHAPRRRFFQNKQMVTSERRLDVLSYTP